MTTVADLLNYSPSNIIRTPGLGKESLNEIKKLFQDFNINYDEPIEENYLEAVLDDIQRVTLKLCYFSISSIPAKKFLSDGRNAHLIQKPARWWVPKLCERFDIEYFQLNPKQAGFITICRSLNFK